ncbi:MAG: phosphate butyryltransferase [FCB group bacterium]|nr:phosphate butyryltransferase [FCB group bacterium]
MFNTFEEIRKAAVDIENAKVAVPMGFDKATLEALLMATDEGEAEAVIVAPKEKVMDTLALLGRDLPQGMTIIDTDDESEAARKAVELVSTGDATFLMKGMLKTSVFLRSILDEEVGLRTGRVLSHVVAVKTHLMDRMVLVSDGGMNITPDREEIKQIIQNSVEMAVRLGVERPKVALLSAVEVVNPKMPETVMFAEIAEEGLDGCDILGPVAVDGALDPESVEIKKIKGPVAGRADILIVPYIATGNIMCKALMYMAGAEISGLVMGAAAPIVMLSRSDTPQTKLNSLALGVVVAGCDNV